MMYPYLTLSDDTLITHSHLLLQDGAETVEVHFERPTEDGFDMARCTLPSYTWLYRQGFSDEEMRLFDELLSSNAHLFFKYAKSGGSNIA
jgi:hypothetical protein